MSGGRAQVEPAPQVATPASAEPASPSPPARPAAPPFDQLSSEGWYLRVGKPLLDRLSALALLVLLSPTLVAAMLAVRVTLGPGVFFVQQRIGLRGQAFSTYKLRTMAHDGPVPRSPAW